MVDEETDETTDETLEEKQTWNVVLWRGFTQIANFTAITLAIDQMVFGGWLVKAVRRFLGL